MIKEDFYKLPRIIAAAVIAAAALALDYAGADLPTVALYILSYAIAGFDVALGAVKNLFHGKVFDECFLMTLATAGALATGEYAEACAVMIFYQTGEFLGDLASDKSRDAISALVDTMPDTARVRTAEGDVTVNASDVKKGDVIVVFASERIALDGRIIEGKTSVDESSITGESLPVERAEGDGVFGGTVNLSGAILVIVEREYGESAVAKILSLIETSSEKKAKTENFITAFSKIYTPCVVFGAVLLCVVPTLLGGAFDAWLHRALTFLVVSCPCALVVSVPLAFFCGMGGASRSGILFKGAGCVEAAANTDTVVFDKTGTLTSGTFGVSRVIASGITEEELLLVASAAERCSDHPVAKCIASSCVSPLRAENVREIAGQGVAATVDGREVLVGNRVLLESNGVTPDGESDGTTVFVARDGKYIGRITVSDDPKSDARETLRELKAIGIKKTVILTGDSVAAGAAAREIFDADEVYAGLLPEDKVAVSEKLMTESRGLMFVGDGINDAPAITRADVGVAMGALGSDAAIEAADIVLADDRPSKTVTAIRAARRIRRVAAENVILSLAVKAAILVLGALGMADMWMAVVGDVGVMLVCVLNSVRTVKSAK